MSKSIELRKVSQEAWRDYLATCHEIDVEHHEELLEVFMTAPDLIRAALAHRDKRRATKRFRQRLITYGVLRKEGGGPKKAPQGHDREEQVFLEHT